MQSSRPISQHPGAQAPAAEVLRGLRARRAEGTDPADVIAEIKRAYDGELT